MEGGQKRRVENAPQVQCSYSVPTKIVLENHVGAGDATATRCQQGGHFSAQREGGSLVSSCCEHAASPKVPNEPVLTSYGQGRQIEISLSAGHEIE